MVHFEEECLDMKHVVCKCCHRASLNLSLNSNGYCTTKCGPMKNKNLFIEKKALPIWYDGTTVQYTVPECLSVLSTAEKMLIQKVSPFVPLHHLKYGVMGVTGHCCAFDADIIGFVNTLPRQKNDVSMLRVLKKVKSEIGDKCNDYDIKPFRVRKRMIYDALTWLKKFNSEYKDIKIDMSALDWLAGEEGLLECTTIETDEIVTSVDNTAQNADIGPAPSQATPQRKAM